MTIKEAIKLIRELPTVCYYADAYGGPIDDKPELYIKALQMAITALERQDGEKPFYNGVDYECPYCETTIVNGAKPWYCDICGQHIDWTEGE